MDESSMKIKFKISCKNGQLKELLLVMTNIAQFCHRSGVDNIVTANWLYNANGIYEALSKKRLDNIGENSNKEVSFRLDLTQFVVFRDAWMEVSLSQLTDIYYDTLIRTVITVPCLMQFEILRTKIETLNNLEQ